jgi:hypothetical protein
MLLLLLLLTGFSPHSAASYCSLLKCHALLLLLLL